MQTSSSQFEHLIFPRFLIIFIISLYFSDKHFKSSTFLLQYILFNIILQCTKVQYLRNMTFRLDFKKCLHASEFINIILRRLYGLPLAKAYYLLPVNGSIYSFSVIWSSICFQLHSSRSIFPISTLIFPYATFPYTSFQILHDICSSMLCVINCVYHSFRMTSF